MNGKREREIGINECMVMSYNGVVRISWFTVRAAMMCMVASALAAAASAHTAAVVAPQFEAAGAFSYVRAKAANTGAGFDLNGGVRLLPTTIGIGSRLLEISVVTDSLA